MVKNKMRLDRSFGSTAVKDNAAWMRIKSNAVKNELINVLIKEMFFIISVKCNCPNNL